ncbi:MAG: hypothetical protein CVT79_03735 [Alphaproteobacteria bacterium HGW-Alphaproteobacteria-18]|nr:MAG: hypothetical protein CVT79_03735 [Alphaproteobacteria bacterium HGW-Alphaproteobacteria-18]
MTRRTPCPILFLHLEIPRQSGAFQSHANTHTWTIWDKLGQNGSLMDTLATGTDVPAGAAGDALRIEGRDFHDADLRGQDFSGVRFHHCELRGARLDWANLAGACFNHARLLNTSMTHAHLRGASLKGANLRSAKLTQANLVDADMTGANLWQADLSGANLCGATCLWGDITKARFAGALYDNATRLPPGFRPEAEGMIRFDMPRA